jgi:hypothetical protein
MPLYEEQCTPYIFFICTLLIFNITSGEEAFRTNPLGANVPVLNQTGTKGEHWSQFVSRWATLPAGPCPLAAYDPDL